MTGPVPKPERDEDLQLLDVRAIKALTGLRERFIRELLYTRRLPVVKLGKFVFVRRPDLVAWIESNTSAARAER